MTNEVFSEIFRSAFLRSRLCLALTISVVASGCATKPPAAVPAPVTPAPKPVPTAEENALRTLVAQQDRLYRISAPLLVNNTELCKGNARNLLGFTAKNKYSYSTDFINAAQSVLNLGERLQVTGVLSGSGAARAGVKSGDIIATVEDRPMPQGPDAERQAPSVLGPLLSGRKSLKLGVIRGETNIVLSVPLTPACAFGVEIGNADLINSYSDGRRILVTRGMIVFTENDAELAYVVGKEMAHNILGHARKQKNSATISDIIDNLINIRPDLTTLAGSGGIKPYPQDMDVAADTLSLYIVARAGYNLDGAPGFWQQLAVHSPPSLLNGHTALHPAFSARIAAINKTIATIKSKQSDKKPLLP